MVSISSELLTGTGQTQLFTAKTKSVAYGTSEDSSAGMSQSSGDTVSISDEARELLAKKLEEYGADSVDELTSEQQGALMTQLGSVLPEESSNGVAASASGDAGGTAQVAFVSGSASTAHSVTSSGSASSASSTSSSGSDAAGPGSTEESSDSDEDTIENLQEEIEKLQEEISQLQSKANDDVEAKDELDAKRIELASLQSELAMLQEQSAE